MGSMSVMHWMVLLVIILILFGAGRLPRVMGDFAKGIKAFKSGMQEEETAAAAPPVTGPAVAAPYVAQPAAQPQPVHAAQAQPAYPPQAAHAPPMQPPAAPPTMAPAPPAAPAASHPGSDYRTGSAA